VVDTSVLIAGVAGFKSELVTLDNPSAKLLRQWVESETFVWLVSKEMNLPSFAVLFRAFALLRFNVLCNFFSQVGEGKPAAQRR
jgi:hypothetical protein